MTHQRIVLTGGPCGGKTTAMARIAERLESLGFRVFMVPETPTMLFQGGFSLHDVTSAQIVELETVLLTTVMQTEDSFRRIASVYANPKTVFLCDRGMMDTKAYVTPDMWQTILDNMGSTEVQLRDQRYDAVIHLVTAADGAEDFYTLANNMARTETPEQARDLDRKTQAAWVGHPHLRVVQNHSDFDEKIREAVAAICRVVGVPEPQEDERKFLVASVDEIPVPHVTVDVEQVYLVNKDHEEERVRRRGRDTSFVYTHTIKRRKGPGSAAEFDRMITPAEHLMALDRRDLLCATVRKRRTCFVWEGQYFELDTYTEFDCLGQPLTVLEIEVEDLGADVQLPPFVKIEREVTGEKAFSNRELAGSLRGWSAFDTLYERVREEGVVNLVLPSEKEADRISDEMYGLTEAISVTGLNPRVPGQPYVLTITHTPIFD
jgi:CYTH domain-containing protein/predicted ATPase